MKFRRLLIAAPLMGMLALQPLLAAASSEDASFNSTTNETIGSSASASDPIVKIYATVNVEGANLNVRKGPSTSDEIIGKLKSGEQVEVVEQYEEWIKIAYNGSYAYVFKAYVFISSEEVTPADDQELLEFFAPTESTESTEPEEPEDLEIEKLIGTVNVEDGNLNVRKGPSTSHQIVGKLQRGNKVEVVEQLDEWVKIPYNGSFAYLSKPYVSIVKTNVKVPREKRKVIVLDPGHGGKDSGAKALDGSYERTYNWKYTLKAKEQLEKAGYTVYLTRSENDSCMAYKKSHEDLACRVAISGQVNADIYISIHSDANPSKNFRGTVTFYNGRSDYDGNMNPYPDNSRLLADLIHRQIQPAMGSKDRGVQNANYFVNRMNSVPSVLIELACLTNSADLKIIKDKNQPQKFAAALVKAVNQYYSM